MDYYYTPPKGCKCEIKTKIGTKKLVFNVYSKRQFKKLFKNQKRNIIGYINPYTSSKNYYYNHGVFIDNNEFGIKKYTKKRKMKGFMELEPNKFVGVSKSPLRLFTERAIFALVMLLIIALLASYLYYQYSIRHIKTVNPYEIDPNASYEGVPSTENTHFGSIEVPVIQDCTIPIRSKTIDLNLTNPKDNPCYVKLTLKLGSGEVLYQSLLIPPGATIKTITINKPFTQKGNYDAVLFFDTYALGTFKDLNKYQSDFQIHVT